jgi:large subunit ribosomal protein L6
MKPDQMEYKVPMPQTVECSLVDGTITVKGAKGETKRKFVFPKIAITKEGTDIVFRSKKPTKREKAAIFTTEAHLKNMFKAAAEGCMYKLKICSGHFPMKVAYKNNVLEVKNFMGETVPRTLKIKPGVNVELKEPEIIVTATDLELAGQTAASIEQLTRRTNFDRRIFQDGIYITVKNGIEVPK